MFRPLKIRQHLAFMKARGYAEKEVLAGSGIDLEMLSIPTFLISIDQYKTVVSNMISLTGDHGIGLEIGRHTKMVDIGLLGYAAMSSKNTREAVQYWISYCNTLVGMAMQLHLEENAPDDWSLVFSTSVPLDFIYHFCVEEQLMMIYQLGEDLAEVTTLIKQIDLSYPAPPHHARYKQYLKGSVKFDARHTRMSLTSPSLDQVLRGNNVEFNEMCANQCRQLMRQIDQEKPVASRVKHILMRFGGRIPTIEAVAREMNISSRTLCRHLTDEGSNYRQLTSEFHADLAKEYLRTGAVTPKEISYLLGFRHSSSFHRAFKEWTGETVQEYRKPLIG